MPCPPSYEEQEMSRYYNAKTNLTKELKELKPKGDSTLKVLVLLKELYQTNSEDKRELANFDKAIKKLEEALDFDLAAVLEEPQFSDGWPTAEDVDKAQNFQKTITAIHNKLEFTLCEIRQLIYLMSFVFEEQNIPKSSSLADLLEVEKERHIEHREEDRRAELQRLKSQIGAFKTWIKKYPEHESNESKKDQIEEMEEKIDKIKSFTLEQILRDRLIFFK